MNGNSPAINSFVYFSGYNIQETALSMAVQKRLAPSLIAKMLQCGCNPDIPNLTSISAFGYATQMNDNLATVRELLLSGAKGDKGSCDMGRGALNMAGMGGQIPNLKMLLSAGCHIGHCTAYDASIASFTPDAQKVMKACLNTPQNLQDICRMYLLKASTSIINKVDAFGLPKVLKCYLMLGDFVHETITSDELNHSY